VQGCKGRIGIWQTAQRLLVIPSVLTLTCGDMRARRPRAIVNATTLLSGSLLGDAYCTGKSQNSIVSRWVLHSPFPSAFLADRGPFLLHGCRSRVLERGGARSSSKFKPVLTGRRRAESGRLGTRVNSRLLWGF
jgi:hypothetical protein